MNDQISNKLDNLIELQKEANALFAVSLKKDTLKSTLIEEMSKAGISPKRIALLLDTTQNTVNVALSKNRKKTK